MTINTTNYTGKRFPAGVIDHAAWLYQEFALSLRHGELILAERDVTETPESVRRRVLMFGALRGARSTRTASCLC